MLRTLRSFISFRNFVFVLLLLLPIFASILIIPNFDSAVANTLEEESKRDFEAEFVVPPNGAETKQGVSVSNPNPERPLRVRLRCLQQNEVSDIKVEGTTPFFNFKVENVTRDCPGYEIIATFEDVSTVEELPSVHISVPAAENPKSPQANSDPSIFIFNSITGNWAEARGGGKPTEPGKAFATLTESYNKVIAGVIKYPDILSHDPSSFTPKALLTSVDNLDPTMGYHRIVPPEADAQGGASLELPLMLRPVRGPNPEIRITYNSTAGTGFLGHGWDISIPEITVDTVSAPFHAKLETEDYRFRGHLLFPYDSKAKKFLTPNRRGGQLRERNDKISDKTREYRLRDVSSGVIVIRHGLTPQTYTWEVYDPQSGQTSLYGSDYDGRHATNNPAVERGKDKAISRWLITETYDNQKAQNRVVYHYDDCHGSDAPCRRDDGAPEANHTPVLSHVTYNDAKNHEAIKNEPDSWEQGKTTISFEYEQRQDDGKRTTTHGRYGAIVKNTLWLKKLAVIYHHATGHERLFSHYNFTYDKGNNPALNYRTHLVSATLEASPDRSTGGPENLLVLTTANDEIKSQKAPFSSALERQVFNFNYHESSLTGDAKKTVEWTTKNKLLDNDLCSESSVERPRVISDLMGCTGLGEATSLAALGTSISDERGGSLHVAVGVGSDVESKLRTVGVKLSSNNSTSTGLSSLVDLDGDGIVDLVERREAEHGTELWYCSGQRKLSTVFNRHLSDFIDDETLTTKIAHGEACTKVKIDIGDFSNSRSDTFNFAFEMHIENAIVAGLGQSDTKNRTSTYFADVDGDGLIDIVHNTHVFFNLGRDANGVVHFEPDRPLIAELPEGVQIEQPQFVSDQKKAFELEREALERRLNDYPSFEPVVLWRAPASGFVELTGTVRVDVGSEWNLQVFRNRGDLVPEVCSAKMDVTTGEEFLLSDINLLLGCNGKSAVTTPTERFSPSEMIFLDDSKVLRVEENDVVHFVLKGKFDELAEEYVEPIYDPKIQYRLIDWDETFNAEIAGTTSPFGVRPNLPNAAPQTEFSLSKAISPHSGKFVRTNIPSEAIEPRFQAIFKDTTPDEALKPEAYIHLINASGTLFSLDLRNAKECSRSGTTTTCSIDLDSKQTHSLSLEIDHAQSRGGNMGGLVWLEPPRVSFRNPPSKIVTDRKNEIATSLWELKGATYPDAKKIRTKLKAEREQFKLLESHRIAIGVPVYDARFSRVSQRVSNVKDSTLQTDELLQSASANVERHAESELLHRLCVNTNTVLKALQTLTVDPESEDQEKFEEQCKATLEILADTTETLSSEIKNQGGDNEFRSFVAANENEAGKPDLIKVWNDLIVTLKGEPTLLYDTATVTQTGFRLPAPSNPIECIRPPIVDRLALQTMPVAGDATLIFEVAPAGWARGDVINVDAKTAGWTAQNHFLISEIDGRTITIDRPLDTNQAARALSNPQVANFGKPCIYRLTADLGSVAPEVTFGLRNRLFINGQRQDLFDVENATAINGEVVFEVDGRTTAVARKPVFSFRAFPGDLLFLELTTEASDGRSVNEAQILRDTSNVLDIFGTAEFLLETNSSPEYGYVSYICNNNSDPEIEGVYSSKDGICKKEYREAITLQTPVFLPEVPSNFNAEESDPKTDPSPLFTFNEGGWSIAYRRADAKNVAASELQFPKLDVAFNNAALDACHSALAGMEDPAPSDNGKEDDGFELIEIARETRADTDKHPLNSKLPADCSTIDSSTIDSAQIGATPSWLLSPLEPQLLNVSYHEWRANPSEAARKNSWTWLYAAEQTDLVVWKDLADSPRIHMGFGRLGPAEGIIEAIRSLDDMIKSMNSENFDTPSTTHDGEVYRERGRPFPGDNTPKLYGPVQMSESASTSLTLSGGPVSGTLINSSRKTTANFLDVNGDGFPEFVDSNGSGSMTSPVGILRKQWFDAFKASSASVAGDPEPASGFWQSGRAKSGTVGFSVAPPTAGQFLTRLVNTITSGTVEGNFSLSVSANFGGGYNQSNIAFADFNGDGLIDPYTEPSKFTEGVIARLNAGGSAVSGQFQGDIRQADDVPSNVFDRFGTNSSAGFGVNLGYAANNNSLSGGVGTGFRTSGAYFTFMDFTGDGLVDLVYPVKGGLVVVANLGSGYDPKYAKFHAIGGFKFNQSTATESVYTDIGGNITGGVTAFGLKATFTVGLKDTESYARTLLQIRDFNADGLPDIAQESSVFKGLKKTDLPPIIGDYLTGLPRLGAGNGDITVHYNPEGRVGLLKQVTQPTGSKIRLDYALIGNTGPEHGRAVWSLARVESEDTYQPSQVQFDDEKTLPAVGSLPADGHDIVGQFYRYGGGHYNRAEKLFYGFSQTLRDDYGGELTGSDKHEVTLLRRTARNLDNRSYFGRGAILSELVVDPDPLNDIKISCEAPKCVDFEANQIVSRKREAYSIYDFTDISKFGGKHAGLWQSSESEAKPLFIRKGVKGDLTDDQSVYSKIGDSKLASTALKAYIDESNDDLADLEEREYSAPFESFIGARRNRLSILGIHGENSRVAVLHEEEPKTNSLVLQIANGLPTLDIHGDAPSVKSAIGYDPDQWGQPKRFFDIGRSLKGGVSETIANTRSLRAEINYARLDIDKNLTAKEDVDVEGTRPLLGRASNIRISRGLHPRPISTGDNDFLRGRQALYNPRTGNLSEICVLASDVRKSLCREFVDALEAAPEIEANDRVETGLNSVTIEASKLIHSRILDYDSFGNPLRTVSALNDNGEWLLREFDYVADTFRRTPTRILLTRCLQPGEHSGKDTPKISPPPMCAYSQNDFKRSAMKVEAVTHRSLQGVDPHFGTVAILTDINNHSLLTEVDRWGRPIWVARSFGGENTGSAGLEELIQAVAKRYSVDKPGLWTPVLSVDYVSPNLDGGATNLDREDSDENSANNILFRSRISRYVSGEFYRGLSRRSHTLGAVHAYTLADGDGKVVQEVRESEVCVTPFNSNKVSLERTKTAPDGAFLKSDKSAFALFSEFWDGDDTQIPSLGLETVGGPILTEADRTYSHKVRNSSICETERGFRSIVVQPGPAVDGLGRQTAQFEAYAGPELPNDVATFVKVMFPVNASDLGYAPIAPDEHPIALIPLKSTVYDAADRPLFTVQRLGLLARAKQDLDAAAKPLTKSDTRSQKGFVETSQMVYRVGNRTIDGGDVFSAMSMSPRCTISEETFDPRGLILRASQQHDKIDKSEVSNADAPLSRMPPAEQNVAGVVQKNDASKLSNAFRYIGSNSERFERTPAFYFEKSSVDLHPKISDLTPLPLRSEPSIANAKEESKLGYDLTQCGRIRDFEWDPAGGMVEPQSVGYQYDALRQLSRVVLPSAGPLAQATADASLGNISIFYDNFGRRVGLFDVNTGYSAYTYDNLNNLVSESSGRQNGNAATRKDYTYAADRLVRISYDGAFDRNGPSRNPDPLDEADTVFFFHDGYAKNIPSLLTDEKASRWFSGALSEQECSNCIGRVAMVKDRSGLKASRYTPLGQERASVRSIVHPFSRQPKRKEEGRNFANDFEIGRYRQRNVYTEFGDLVATELEDLRPTNPSNACSIGGDYICGGTVNLGYRHTPDGKLASVSFAEGNQKIISMAYDALARPIVSRTGDLTYTLRHFDPIDLRLNRVYTKTAVGSEVQNVSFQYERGGNILAYKNATEEFRVKLRGEATKTEVSENKHTAEFAFSYDTPNRLIGMNAKINGAKSEGSYWYDDAHRFMWRTLDRSLPDDKMQHARSWVYRYPSNDNNRPKHAPLSVALSSGKVGIGMANANALALHETSTDFDALGRLTTIRPIAAAVDPEEQSLTQRRLKWDAENRLRFAEVRLPSGVQSLRRDADPTGERAGREENFPKDCTNRGTPGTNARLACRVEDHYTYDFGSNRAVKLTLWPEKSDSGRRASDEDITLYVSPFYARSYQSRGTVQVTHSGQTVASIDMPYHTSAARPGATYLFSDLGVGSVSASVRTPGEPGVHLPVISRREYSPYGLSLSSNDTAALDSPKIAEKRRNGQTSLFSFHGKQFDASTGFSNFGARYYSRDIGTWLSADPALIHVSSDNAPVSLSAYSFSNNNPIGFLDPNGEKAYLISNLNDENTGEGASSIISDLLAKVTGVHSSIVIINEKGGDNLIYDPSGSFEVSTRGSGDVVYGDRKKVDKFIKYQLQDGPKVFAQELDLSATEEQTLVEDIENSHGAAPAMCATTCGGKISQFPKYSGVGSFRPKGLSSSLESKGAKKVPVLNVFPSQKKHSSPTLKMN